MECDRKQINNLVRHIRAGKPPQLPDGKREEFHILKDALGSFGSFGIREWLSGTGIGTAWALQSKRHGRQRKKHIGSVHVLDTDQALKAAKDLAAKMQLELLDPVQAKKDAMKAAKVTFASVADQFLAAKRDALRPNTRRSYELVLKGYYFKPLHNLPIDEITGQQIQLQVERITNQSGPSAAWRANSPLKGMFKWAIKHNLFAGPSPMLRVDEPAKSDPRSRVLEDDEIRTLWKLCLDWEAEVLADDELETRTGKRSHAGKRSIPDFARAVHLLFLTGCRAQEIGDLKWSEIKWKSGELHIPRSRIKTDTDLLLPLTDGALAILRSIERKPGREFVFGQVGNKGRSASGAGAGIDLTTIRKKIDRRIAEALKPSVDAKEEQVRRLLGEQVPTYRIRSRAHVNWQHIQKIKAKMQAERDGSAIAEQPALPEWFKPIADWTAHDIRRTVRTRMAEIGILPHIGERILNHLGHIDPMQRNYDYHKYKVEMRQALERWEAKLNSIITGTEEKIVAPSFGQQSA
jgi:integrase